MSRRVLSLFLVTLLCVSLARVTAFAKGSNPPTTQGNVTYIGKVEGGALATSNTLNVSSSNFVIVIKQANPYVSCWTAQPLTDEAKQDGLSTFLRDGSVPSDISNWEFHTWDGLKCSPEIGQREIV
jgi:hypothetical protein